MGNQAPTTQEQAGPKQSREEKKIEHKFKALSADCEKFRERHPERTIKACEAHSKGEQILAREAVEKKLFETFTLHAIAERSSTGSRGDSQSQDGL